MDGLVEKFIAFTKVRAYFLWKERVEKGLPGTPLGDWLAARKYIRETFPWLDDHPDGNFILKPMLYEPDIDAALCSVCGHCLNQGELLKGSVQCDCCGAIIGLYRDLPRNNLAHP
ncbi:MAG TPA: hypothetical protein VMU07_03795 [Candidatus Paceibacterota bacterium]|nr:hypothetical protein [Candidatus Paceibacterota bacterium]